MKIVFAGAGYIINIHANAAKNTGAELTAVVEKAELFARKFHIKNHYESIEELLVKAGSDAIVIGTPNFLHAPQAIAALDAGVHVMVEKPMAMNSTEAEKMMEASAKSGTKLMVAHCWRPYKRRVLSSKSSCLTQDAQYHATHEDKQRDLPVVDFG